MLTVSQLDLNSHATAREAVEMIGDAWQSAGATGLCVLQNGKRFWIRGFTDAEPGLAASARDREGNEYTIEVMGLPESAEHRVRLRSDVMLIASVAQLDTEVGQLTDRLIEQQDQLVAVSQLANAVRDRQEAREVMETLVELAAAITGAEYAAAVVATADARHAHEYPAGGESRVDLDGVFRYVCEINRSILLADTDHETWPPPFGIEPAYRRLVIAPIRISGQIAGVIAVLDRRSELLTIASRHLLETVAAQAEAIIELILAAEQMRRRDRLERDAELARAVQRNLVPIGVPAVAGLDVATRYRPAAELGGDLFECVRRADGRLVIGVADVSGKGTSAALVMAAARMSVRGAAFRGTASDAASMMKRIFEDLYDDLGNMSRFLTIFLGVIDPERGQIVTANAGHSPVIFAPASGPVTMLGPGSPPIGVLPDFSMQNQIYPFEPGDLILVATDGFPEAAAPNGELFGYERILELVEQMRSAGAEEIARALTSAVDEFAGETEQSDDQALIVVKRRAA